MRAYVYSATKAHEPELDSLDDPKSKPSNEPRGSLFTIPKHCCVRFEGGDSHLEVKWNDSEGALEIREYEIGTLNIKPHSSNVILIAGGRI